MNRWSQNLNAPEATPNTGRILRDWSTIRQTLIFHNWYKAIHRDYQQTSTPTTGTRRDLKKITVYDK